jgi:ABC-type cobalamin/Fe3+-siderophores transport system ATPase subunit
MDLSQGLKFKKFDLHVHTPDSEDYKDKSVTAQNIVDQAISKGLTGIAITDHQTGDWVDSIKEAAQGKNLIIFPGTELKVNGGKDGIHLIIIFDVDKTTEHIKAFLNKLGTYQHKGKTSITNKTVAQVAEELQRYDKDAILILAHCDSTFGVDSDMRGEQRSNIFKPEWICLLGAEASETNFFDEDKKQKHTRIIDLFDGDFQDFHNKKLGVYQASDSHSLAEIGSKYTYFKVDDPITIEDIRQSLIDRDTRIRQCFEYKEFIYPRILNLKITSGFLADQEFSFHEGLNSILGAKGSGKSLVIEFLRFCLNQQPNNQEILSDHKDKLEKCLKIHGEIKVLFMDDSGKEYVVKRVLNPAESNPVTIIDPSDNSEKNFQVEQIFPVLFLSQNEIIKIAEDKTGSSQRRFIDQFFDFYKYQQDIEKLNSDLDDVDQKVSDVLNAHLKTLDIKKKISTHREEIAKLGRQIQNTVFDEYSKKEKIGQALQGQLDFIDLLRQMIVNSQSEYKDITPPEIEDQDTNQNPAVKRASDVVAKILDQTKQRFENSIEYLDTQKKAIGQEINDWRSSFKPIKIKYDEVVKDAGGTQVILDQKRKLLNTNLAKFERDLTKHQGKAQQAHSIGIKRGDIIRQLDNAYKSFFQARKDRCDYFTKNSNRSLQVSIKERGDKTAFKNNLLKFKRGSWLKDEEIDVISQKISPRDFIDNLLRYSWSNRVEQKFIKDISDKTGIKIESIEKLTQHLLDEYDIKKILALFYTSVPKDVPTIKYKVEAEFKTLNELSVGQKAVALLIIALSDGTFPIVIDQPEDSLDLRSIWDDVCCKLRDTKDQRQFIFTTHNSSVAVASDSDKFTILQANAVRGWILYSGSINRKEIKKEVIDYLEGGPDTYEQKRQKYNIY